MKSTQNNSVDINISSFLFPKQLEVFMDIVNSDNSLHIINASRQSGKSFLISVLAVLFALSEPKVHTMMISPTYTQANILFNNTLKLDIPKELIDNINNSKPKSITFANGSTIFFVSADRPHNIRGSSNKYVLIDEFAFIKDATFLSEKVRPTTATFQKPKIILSSTPYGTQGVFYDLYHSNSPYISTLFMHYTDNPKYNVLDIEIIKASMDAKTFLQEYEARFLDDSAVFSNFSEVCDMDTFLPMDMKVHRYTCGIDWGAANDKTVLTVMSDDKKLKIHLIAEFSGPWEVQMVQLVDTLTELAKPRIEKGLRTDLRIEAENNSIGNLAITMLRQEARSRLNGIVTISVSEFNMTNSSKLEIINKLRMLIESKKIHLPSSKLCPQLYRELSGLIVERTPTGQVRYTHSKGKHDHDDYIDSLAITVHELENITGQHTFWAETGEYTGFFR